MGSRLSPTEVLNVGERRGEGAEGQKEAQDRCCKVGEQEVRSPTSVEGRPRRGRVPPKDPGRSNVVPCDRVAI